MKTDNTIQHVLRNNPDNNNNKTTAAQVQIKEIDDFIQTHIRVHSDAEILSY